MRKTSLVIIAIILAISLVGCGKEYRGKSDEAAVLTQTHPNNIRDIVKIEVNFNDQIAYWSGIKPIKVENKKMIGDILEMIAKAKPIEDETRLSKLGPEQNRISKLILIDKKGSQKEVNFAFQGLYDIGYIEIDSKKFEPDYSFFRYILDLNGYIKPDTNIDTEVNKLFKKYNWTVDYKVNSIQEKLPQNLKHGASEYPYKLYWAYNNEMSKAIGMDFTAYLGKKLEVEIYRLREVLPEYMKPINNARGIVLKNNNKIVGAYIDSGRHSPFACSLDRKSLKDITNKDWDEWLKGYIDYEDEFEKRIAKMKPEEVIKEYFTALNNHDEKTATACLSRTYMTNYLTMNMDNNLLLNVNNEKIVYNNINNIRLLNIKESNFPDRKQGEFHFWVDLNIEYETPIVEESGNTGRIIRLKQEYEGGGWKISSIGTG